MSTTAELLKNVNVAAGVGTFGTDLFVGFEPSEPDACVTLFDTTGGPQNPKWALDVDGVSEQIRSARGDYAGGYAKALAAKNAKLGMAPSGEIRGVTLRAGIQHLGPDEQDRHHFVMDWLVTREPASAGHRATI